MDELKRKTEKTEREFEEFKIQQQEEYNKLREDIMRFGSSSGNCGGINPYTLMAKLGPARIGGSGPPKDNVRPG